MRKAKGLLILGIWIAIIPYTGFPYSWKDVLTTLSGLLLAYLGYSLYQDFKREKNENFDSFAENGDFDGTNAI